MHNESGREYLSGQRIAPGGTFIWKSTDDGYTDGLRSGSYPSNFVVAIIALMRNSMGSADHGLRISDSFRINFKRQRELTPPAM